MREVTFTWKDGEVRIVPSFLLIQRIATKLRRVSDGAETTVSLAQKCLTGGLEPAFVMVPLAEFLAAGLGAACPTEDEIFEEILTRPEQLVSFRMAYMQAILPAISLGKPQGGTKADVPPKAKKSGRPTKS